MWFSKKESAKQYSDNAVVFQGSCAAWQAYLMRLPQERYDPDTVLVIKSISAAGEIKLVNDNGHPDSEALIGLVRDGFR